MYQKKAKLSSLWGKETLTFQIKILLYFGNDFSQKVLVDIVLDMLVLPIEEQELGIDQFLGVKGDRCSCNVQGLGNSLALGMRFGQLNQNLVAGLIADDL